jgi:hypothetical protein
MAYICDSIHTPKGNAHKDNEGGSQRSILTRSDLAMTSSTIGIVSKPWSMVNGIVPHGALERSQVCATHGERAD